MNCRKYNHEKREINKKKSWFSRLSLNEKKMNFDRCIKRDTTGLSKRYYFWVQKDNEIIVTDKRR